MNANNYVNFDLVKYATLIGALIVFLYTEFVHLRKLMAQQSRKRRLPISLKAYPLDIPPHMIL